VTVPADVIDFTAPRAALRARLPEPDGEGSIMRLPMSGYSLMTILTTVAALATIVGLLVQLRGQPGGKQRRERRRH
jgi:hypothetical protein